MSTGAGNNLLCVNPPVYVPINTNTTATIFKGPGIFFGLQVVNAGTAWVITVYDNTAASGNLLSPSLLAITLGEPDLGIPPQGVWCQTGLTIVTSGTTPGVLNVLYQVI
jgi:hypothetical protein